MDRKTLLAAKSNGSNIRTLVDFISLNKSVLYVDAIIVVIDFFLWQTCLLSLVIKSKGPINSPFVYFTI